MVVNEEKEFFRLHAEFRTLFHTTDVNLVKGSNDEFKKRLRVLSERLMEYFRELSFRRNYSVFFMLLFAGMGVIIYLLYKDRLGR